MAPNPRFVAGGQEIDLSVQAVQAGLPTDVNGALQVLSDPAGAALRIANGQAVHQHFLHLPDSNPAGVGTPNGAFAIGPVVPPPALPSANVSGDPDTTQAGVGAATTASAATAATPVLTAADGKPVTWAGATGAPGQPGDPTQISVAIATRNFTSDQGIAAPFSNAFPTAFVPLLNAAEHEWESLANVKFTNIPDDATTRVSAADIRVGVSALSQGLTPNTMGFIGYTTNSWDANDQFLSDSVLTIDDPADRPVTALADGDFRYSGFQTTVFQDLLHELGHAIGLAHNPNDPNSIMNPVLSAANPLPDAADAAAVQSLYGVPTGSVMISQADLGTLHAPMPTTTV